MGGKTKVTKGTIITHNTSTGQSQDEVFVGRNKKVGGTLFHKPKLGLPKGKRKDKNLVGVQ